MTKFNLSFPHTEEGQKEVFIQSGEIMFMVGPNGSGKSTLMHIFTTQNPGKVLRITAHRQVWFNSDSIDLTPASRLQTEQNISNIDRQEQSRWKDQYADQRSQATIFDLIDSENIDARKIAKAAREGNLEAVAKLATSQAPVAKMNDILKLSNLHFQVSIDQGSKLIATREGYPSYGVAQLSDGERNAILIIANVLTATEGTLILLDEPERHLHRSIVSPLISTLLSYRQDCAFVISTHDVSLPHDQEKSAALLLRKYLHQPRAWQADFIQSVEEMDEETALSVLGSRRKLLFIEGKGTSLDLQLYQILYPDTTIKPLGSCLDIERVVKGIRESHGNHWISAFGVIDRDDRSDEECNSLKLDGIIPLNQYSIESIYYHPKVIKKLLERIAAINPINPETTFKEIQDSVIFAIKKHTERMAARLTQRKAKIAISKLAPDWRDIQSQKDIYFSPSQMYQEELQTINKMMQAENIEALISRYPIRETQALEAIAKGALFQSTEKYEQAVRKMLVDSSDARAVLREILAPITDRICNDQFA